MSAGNRRRLSLEDFRPSTLEEIRGQPLAIARLRRILAGVRHGTVMPPHLLFHGPPGVGKTAAARAFGREALGDYFEADFSELKAFDSRDHSALPEIILKSRGPPLDHAPFRILFFDELDSLDPAAQNDLRPALEGEGGFSQFILACNEIHGVAKALLSRCTVLEFHTVETDAMRQIVDRALVRSQFALDAATVDSVVDRANGVPREAIKLLLEEGGAIPPAY